MGRPVAVKPVVTLWTCCGAVYSVETDENKKSTGSKVFGKLFSRIEKEPITLQHTGPCPECARKALELREEGKRARDEAEARRYERAEAAMRQRATSGMSNRETWERALEAKHEIALGPGDAPSDSKDDTPNRRFTLGRDPAKNGSTEDTPKRRFTLGRDLAENGSAEDTPKRRFTLGRDLAKRGKGLGVR